jgi:hypothetical protein
VKVIENYKNALNELKRGLVEELKDGIKSIVLIVL